MSLVNNFLEAIVLHLILRNYKNKVYIYLLQWNKKENEKQRQEGHSQHLDAFLQ